MTTTRRVYIAFVVIGAVLALAALLLATFSDTKAWLWFELPAAACLATALLASRQALKKATNARPANTSGEPTRDE